MRLVKVYSTSFFAIAIVPVSLVVQAWGSYYLSTIFMIVGIVNVTVGSKGKMKYLLDERPLHPAREISSVYSLSNRVMWFKSL